MAPGLSDQFGSFDFFSVFVPGATFLIGIAPFLPRQTPLASLATVVPLLVGGVVIGRIAYGVSVVTSRPRDSNDRTLVGRTLLRLFDTLRSRPSGEASHREQFVREIRRDDPTFVSSPTADQLYAVAQRQFENGVVSGIDSRTDLSEAAAEELYGLARATIHADGRGRSRKFQSIYAFYRTMLIVSLGLSIVCGFYGVVLAVDAADGLAGYTSYLQAAEIPGVVVALSVFATGLGLAILFGEVRTRYREYYLQCLVLDFIAVHEAGVLGIE